jgi:hypothetical protein
MSINSPESLPDENPPEPAATNGKGGDGGIPEGKEGVGLGATHEPNTFEPEEDPEASDAEVEDPQ